MSTTAPQTYWRFDADSNTFRQVDIAQTVQGASLARALRHTAQRTQTDAVLGAVQRIQQQIDRAIKRMDGGAADA